MAVSQTIYASKVQRFLSAMASISIFTKKEIQECKNVCKKIGTKSRQKNVSHQLKEIRRSVSF